MAFKLTSPAFVNEGEIPLKYTAEGSNINPPLMIKGWPDGTETFVLIIDDPDAATDPDGPGKVFDHWVLFNISQGIEEILEDSVPDAAIQGKNGAGQNKYTGPNPPNGAHRYFFRLYALSEQLDLDEDATKQDVLEEAEPLTIETALLVGTYQREQV